MPKNKKPDEGMSDDTFKQIMGVFKWNAKLNASILGDLPQQLFEENRALIQQKETLLRIISDAASLIGEDTVHSVNIALILLTNGWTYAEWLEREVQNLAYWEELDRESGDE